PPPAPPSAPRQRSVVRSAAIFGNRAANSVRRSAADRLARARTSSWVAGVPATFVRQDTPRTRIPSATPATASGTVDIPTAWAPAWLRNFVSAGVSYEGPGNPA